MKFKFAKARAIYIFIWLYRTPLHTAIFGKHDELVELLLQHGADPSLCLTEANKKVSKLRKNDKRTERYTHFNYFLTVTLYSVYYFGVMCLWHLYKENISSKLNPFHSTSFFYTPEKKGKPEGFLCSRGYSKRLMAWSGLK